MKRIIAFLLVLLMLPAVALADLQVHFLDVGQGDCAVILCDGESMVIDGGPRASSDRVYSYIRNTLGLTRIDYLIATHPHEDHLSGIASVLNAAPVDLILSPVTEYPTRVFGRMLEYAEKQGAVLAVPQEGDTLRLGGAVVTVLHCWPEAEAYGRVNDMSIVLRIDYGETSFLFTGDAEDWSEYRMIDAGAELKADVLKVAHHGSYNACTEEFLRLVSPEYAVISSGAGNEYGHPRAATLKRLAGVGAKLLRTDELGTVILVSDGSSVRVSEPSRTERALSRAE